MSANEPKRSSEDTAPATPDAELRWSPQPEIEVPSDRRDLTARGRPAPAALLPGALLPGALFPPAYSSRCSRRGRRTPLRRSPTLRSRGSRLRRGPPRGSHLSRLSRATRASAGSSR